jgi:hypothetical protein
MPPKRNTGLVVGLAVGGLLVVAAVLITGLVAPGWMRGGGDDRQGSRQAAELRNTAEATVRRVLDAVNRGDTEAASSEACPGSSPGLLATRLPDGVTLALDGDVQETGNTAKAIFNSEIGKFNARLSKRSDDWCVTGVGVELPDMPSLPNMPSLPSVTIPPPPSLPGG